MIANITVLARTIILKFDGQFVGSYDNMDQVNRVIDAYNGLVTR